MTQLDSRPAALPEPPGASSPTSPSLVISRRLTAFCLVLVTLWITIAAFVFHTNQDETVLTSDWQKSVKASVQTVLPEQWGFFTRSPREDELLPYAQAADGTWSSISQYPHSRADHAFGWNRVSRAQGIEIGIIFAAVADEEWTSCSTQETVECLNQLAKAEPQTWLKVSNPSPEPTMCGPVAISKALPPPWAWANIGQAYQEISVILMEVSC